LADEFDVFVSYASPDRERVEKFAKALRSRSVRVWIDFWNLAEGDPLTEAIDKGLKCSRAVVLMLSSHALESRWAREETSIALHQAVTLGKHLVPVLLENLAHERLPAAVAARRMTELPQVQAPTYASLVSGLAKQLTKWRAAPSHLPPPIVHGETARTDTTKPTTLPADTIRTTTSPRRGHSEAINACAITADGSSILTGSDDRTLCLWKLNKPHQPLCLRGHQGLVLGCAVTRNGEVAVSGSHDRALRVWDLWRGIELRILSGHAGVVWACEFTLDESSVLSTSYDRTAILWDLATGRERLRLNGHRSAVRGCAMAPDGQHVVTCSQDRTIRIWDLATGAEVLRIEAEEGTVFDCAVSPDGSSIVSAGADGTIRVRSFANGEECLRLNGHGDAVMSCAVTPRGDVIASASQDQTVRLWSLETGACIDTVRKSHPFFSIAASADVVVAGDAAGRLWKMAWPPPDAGAVGTALTSSRGFE